MGEVSKKGSFVKQAAILAVASMLVRVIGFIYRVPLTNIIGDEGMGLYASGYYIYIFFLILSSAGLPVAISKMVSERTSLRQYRNAHQVLMVSLYWAGGIGLFFSLVLGFGAKSFSNFVNEPGSYASILSLSPTIFLVAILACFRGYFQGLKNSVPTAISQIIEQIFNALFSVLLAYILVKRSLALGAAGGTLGTGIGALSGLVIILMIYYLARPRILKKVMSDKASANYESNGKIATELFSLAIPIIIGTAIFSMTNLIDMKMVSGILQKVFVNDPNPKRATQLYGMLTGKYVVLTTLPVSISTALATAAIPSIASSVLLKETKLVSNKINTALRMTMVLSIPAAMGIGVLGDQILLFLWPNYPDGGILLKVGAVSVVFLSLAQISTGMLQAIGKVKVPAYAALCGAIIKIPLNLLLISIPSVNVTGAVISTTFCYLIASCIDLYYLVKYTGIVPDFISILFKPFVSSIIMGISCYTFYYAVFYFINSNSIALMVSIFVGVITYFVMLLLIKGIDREDIMILPKGSKLVAILDRIGAF